DPPPSPCSRRSCLQPVPAQTPTPTPVTITPASPALGGNVSLAPQNVAQNFTSCNWHRSTTNDETSRILTYFPPPNPVQHNGPAHTGRETAGPGCALHIAGLTLSDTGNYTVQVQSRTSPGLGTVVLRVYGKSVPPPRINTSSGQSPSPLSVPIEPGAVTLSCEAGDSPVSYSWFKDNEIVQAGDHIPLSSDNQTLMLDPGSTKDSGSYTCLATNAASSQNDTVWLEVLCKCELRGHSCLIKTPPVACHCLRRSRSLCWALSAISLSLQPHPSALWPGTGPSSTPWALSCGGCSQPCCSWARCCL
uniref:Ig-like domain-containing protein n=1 Tax=Chelonoidis abingdonii TaxID=106734 RepID=A0A8C0GA23_CHEAB